MGKKALTLKKELIKRIQASTEAVDHLKEAKKVLRAIDSQFENIADTAVLSPLKENRKNIEKHIEELLKQFIPPEDVKGYIYSDDFMNSKLNLMSHYLNSSLESPNSTHRLLMQQNKKELQALLDQVNTFFSGEWEKL